MGGLSTYCGSNTIKSFVDNASNNINKFNNQNTVTKADITNDLKIKNVIYKRSVMILLNAFDKKQAHNKIKDIVINK